MKLIGKIQMARYALQFMVVGDKIKAGKATPEDVAPIGDILTNTVTQKTVEMPKKGIDITALGKGGVTEQVENPQYGKNAFDSTGFRLAGQKGKVIRQRLATLINHIVLATALVSPPSSVDIPG